MKHRARYWSGLGFTIVELLVVIVVIGILAAVTIVSYMGVTQKATKVTLESDLSNATKQIELFKAENSSYPTANNCTNTQPTEICIRPSGDNNYSYSSDNSASVKTFRLTAINPAYNYNYSVNQNGLKCPVNFIIVPGNSTYGTSDFCVMKYEAKQANSTTPISKASGTPWTFISQNNAITYSANVEDCTGCHLITEAEWMTLAQNVASVPSNWNSGVVGTGFIYKGHSDDSMAGPIEASSDDSDGYYLTGNDQFTGENQRRTLTLTNGEVIWDMAGNTYDLTSLQVTSGQQPGIIGETDFNNKQWNQVTDPGEFAINPNPAWGNPAAATWTSANGIGLLYSYVDDTYTRASLRGGWWGAINTSGVFYMGLGYGNNSANQYISFRVAR